jgi:hypothetical protein
VRAHLNDWSGNEKAMVFEFSTQDFDPSVHEFEKEGRFYDVIRFEKMPSGNWLVHCFDDATETELHSVYHQKIIEETAKDTDFGKKTQVFFKKQLDNYCLPSKNLTQTTPSVSSNFGVRVLSFEWDTAVPTSPFLTIDAPPPQVV